MDKRPRYTAVPWLQTAADLRAFGPPETTVECGETITMGLLVPDPFGPGTTAMLSITTADWRAGKVTLAITNTLHFETGKQRDRGMDMDLLSNPRRHEDDEA